MQVWGGICTTATQEHINVDTKLPCTENYVYFVVPS